MATVNYDFIPIDDAGLQIPVNQITSVKVYRAGTNTLITDDFLKDLVKIIIQCPEEVCDLVDIHVNGQIRKSSYPMITPAAVNNKIDMIPAATAGHLVSIGENGFEDSGIPGENIVQKEEFESIDGTLSTSFRIGKDEAVPVDLVLVNGVLAIKLPDGSFAPIRVGSVLFDGDPTEISKETLKVSDNEIELNSDVTSGTPTEDMGIRGKRGNLADALIQWSESAKAWFVGIVGTMSRILLESDLGAMVAIGTGGRTAIEEAESTDYIYIGDAEKILKEDLFAGIAPPSGEAYAGQLFADPTDTVGGVASEKVDQTTITVDETAHKIKIKTAGIGATQLASDAVETAKIKDANVTTAKLADDSVTNAKLANMATGRIKGRVSAETGDVEDLTAAQVRSVAGVFRRKEVLYAANTDGVLIDTGLTEATDKMMVIDILACMHNATDLPTNIIIKLYQAGSGNILNAKAITTGYAPVIYSFIHGGNLKLWFANTTQYSKFVVKAYNTTSDVECTVTSAAKPSSGITKEVSITPSALQLADADLTAIAALTTTGLLKRLGDGSYQTIAVPVSSREVAVSETLTADTTCDAQLIGATTITMQLTTLLAENDYFVIDNEVQRLGSFVSGLTYNVTRNCFGTAAAAHSGGARLYKYSESESWADNATDALRFISGALGTNKRRTITLENAFTAVIAKSSNVTISGTTVTLSDNAEYYILGY